MIERSVFLGSSTQVYVRLAAGATLQAQLTGDHAAVTLAQGTPVNVHLPARALRVLPDDSTAKV